MYAVRNTSWISRGLYVPWPPGGAYRAAAIRVPTINISWSPHCEPSETQSHPHIYSGSLRTSMQIKFELVGGSSTVQARRTADSEA